MFGNNGKSQLELLIGADENVLWSGKPNKRGFILEGIFNSMLPFALFWAFVDLSIIRGIFTGDINNASNESTLFILIFMAVHMMPVWIYLFGILTVIIKYKNTQYAVTEKGVYVSSGVFTTNCDMRPFSEITNIRVHRGIIDQMLGVGDVILSTNDYYRTSRGRTMRYQLSIDSIRDYVEVFEYIENAQSSISKEAKNSDPIN